MKEKNINQKRAEEGCQKLLDEKYLQDLGSRIRVQTLAVLGGGGGGIGTEMERTRRERNRKLKLHTNEEATLPLNLLYPLICPLDLMQHLVNEVRK